MIPFIQIMYPVTKVATVATSRQHVDSISIVRFKALMQYTGWLSGFIQVRPRAKSESAHWDVNE